MCSKLSSHIRPPFYVNGYLIILFSASNHIIHLIMLRIQLHYGYVTVLYKSLNSMLKFLTVYVLEINFHRNDNFVLF